jgi:hypothetical protein
MAIAVALSLVGGWGAAPAQATSYRFWSYWTGGSDWTFSNQGAARRPADGAVEGWRFAISPATSSTIPPRHSPSFSTLCGNTSAEDGKKRVGLVIDSGTTADAPEGESPPALIATCAVVPDDATGYDILLTVAQLRTDAGLICGINGYPATECGVAVSDPAPTPTGDPGGGSGNDSGDGNGNGGGTPSDGSGGSGGSGGTPGNGSGATATAQGNKNTQEHAAGDGKKKFDADGKHSGTNTPKDEASAKASADTTAAAAPVGTNPAAPSNGSPIGVIVGLIDVVVVGVTALFVRRRRA